MRKSKFVMALRAAAGIHPAADGNFEYLFRRGEQGWWYDNQDLSTMFQDSAGTTPVTAVEQPIGLQLDKRFGLTKVEGLLNTAFPVDLSNWSVSTPGAGAINWISPGVVELTRNSSNVSINQAVSVVSGRMYRFRTRGTRVFGNGSAFAVMRQTMGGTSIIVHNHNSTDTLEDYWVSNITGTIYVSFESATTVGNIARVYELSFSEVLGNHRIQPTAARRPVLRSRVNMLTYSEQFDNSDWPKSGSSITANAIAAPDGTLTADKLVEDSANTAHFVRHSIPGNTVATASYKYSCCVKAAERSIVRLDFNVSGNTSSVNFNLATGSVGAISPTGNGVISASSIDSLGNGWFRCNVVATGAAFVEVRVILRIDDTNGSSAYLGDGTSGLYIWGADLRPAGLINLPVYQRIVDAATYETAGFPSYLVYDGVDDSMYTAGTVNFSASDKLSYWTGLRKESDALGSIYLEASSNTAQGSITVLAPPANGQSRFTIGGRGVTGGRVDRAVDGYAAPVSAVLFGSMDMAAGIINVRANGVSSSPASLPATGGTLNNLSYYFGTRNATPLPFTGLEYGQICIGRSASDAEISTVERHYMKQVGLAT